MVKYINNILQTFDANNYKENLQTLTSNTIFKNKALQQKLDKQQKQITQFEKDEDFYIAEIKYLISIIKVARSRNRLYATLLSISIITNFIYYYTLLHP